MYSLIIVALVLFVITFIPNDEDKNDTKHIQVKPPNGGFLVKNKFR